MGERIEGSKRGDLEDATLIKTFFDGDRSAFDALVLRYKDKAFNLCYRFLGNYEEANDCAQEAFVKAYRYLKDFRFESAFSTWLYRITVNVCKNRLTSLDYRQSKKMVRLDNPKQTDSGSYNVEIADESLSPVVEVERKEKENLIQEAIDSLPDEQKTMVVLRDVEGLSYDEIVKITGYKLGTVKSKLSRAREALMEKLKGMI